MSHPEFKLNFLRHVEGTVAACDCCQQLVPTFEFNLSLKNSGHMNRWDYLCKYCYNGEDQHMIYTDAAVKEEMGRMFNTLEATLKIYISDKIKGNSFETVTRLNLKLDRIEYLLTNKRPGREYT